MSVPVKIVVVYHSGYGHTVKLAEAVARGVAATSGASVALVPADEAPSRWDILDGADAIIMGAPIGAVQSIHGCDVETPICRKTLGGKDRGGFHQWRIAWW